MAVGLREEKMLYCPKCSSTYEEGTQRFCTNDGSRLYAGGALAKSASNLQGVFTSLLAKKSSNFEHDEKLSPNLPTKQNKPVETPKPTFHTNFSSKVFKEESGPVNQVEKPIQIPKPVVRLVKPNEIASGTAEVGDRSINPTGRLALNWEGPEVMLEQTVKGRYCIIEKLSQDDSSISYLAEDKIIANKEVVVRVLMEEKNDELLSKIFAEERVSLSHINHPNVVKVLDSGELLEGKPFVVTENVDGFSLKEKLQKLESFNPLRTARVIRQVSFALSEVHQNGILHRSLKPENIYLTVSEAGTEQVKVSNFVVSNGAKKQNLENLKYLSPEQLEGQLPNFASDIYSLGVIAYQMLTGKMPFSFTAANQLVKAQKEGLSVLPSSLRPDISPKVDEVLEKALAYLPADRYPKARDFGDALFNALSISPSLAKVIETESLEKKKEEKKSLPSSSIFIPSLKENDPIAKTNQLKIEAQTEHLDQMEETSKFPTLPKSESTWERRSPEPVKVGSSVWLWISGLGLLFLIAATYLFWLYRPQTPEFATPTNESVSNSNEEKLTITDANSSQTITPTPTEIESPPPPREIPQPPNTEFFQNSKLELKGDLAKNYRGFSLYYPNDWVKNPSDSNFIDISKKAESGTPIEQFLVSYYESKGTFSADLKLFPKLVAESNKKLSPLITNYRFISQAEKNINGGWKGYEMKFEGEGMTTKGEKITLWGRRLFIPAARRGAKSGFVITMLATSLSPTVKKAEDVGLRGDLGSVLNTFEPSSLD